MPVTDMAELRVVYPPPKAQAGLKVLDHLDVHCRDFIALSPFYVISSARADGRADASPRGDPSGITGGGAGPEDPALTGPAGEPSGRHDAESGGAALCRAAVFRSRDDRDFAD